MTMQEELDSPQRVTQVTEITGAVDVTQASPVEPARPPRRSPLVIVGLVLGLVVLVALSFILSDRDPAAAGGGPEPAAVPVVKSSPLPPGSDTAALPAAPVVGKMAPDFLWYSADGKAIHLSDYRGKIVLVNFWATWCPPCKAEMPEMEAYWRENKDKDFVILAVDNGSEDEATIRKFMGLYGLSFQSLNDTAGLVSTAYRVSGIPESFFVDPQGVVRDTVIGGMTKGIIAAKVAKLR
jgi:cytochrome c biogenesis protein CcmG, thiol:disulfide interchange protein DsbE